MGKDMRKYVAVIISSAIRDAQVCSIDTEDADPLDDDMWMDTENLEGYLGIYEGTQEDVLKQAAKYGNTDESNIRLVEIAAIGASATGIVFELVPTGVNEGNWTTPYHVKMKENITVREFMDAVRLRKEQGHVTICSETNKFKEYTVLNDEIKAGAPAKGLDSVVKHATAQCGYRYAAYRLTVE